MTGAQAARADDFCDMFKLILKTGGEKPSFHSITAKTPDGLRGMRTPYQLSTCKVFRLSDKDSYICDGPDETALDVEIRQNIANDALRACFGVAGVAVTDVLERSGPGQVSFRLGGAKPLPVISTYTGSQTSFKDRFRIVVNVAHHGN